MRSSASEFTLAHPMLQLARSQMLPAKELEKLKTRDRKVFMHRCCCCDVSLTATHQAKQAVASADQSYMDSVRTLEEARVLWEREMVTVE